MSDTPRTDALILAEGFNQEGLGSSIYIMLEHARQLERELNQPRYVRLPDVVSRAESKLRSLGHTFSSTNFTDRYGDGPACLALADELRRSHRLRGAGMKQRYWLHYYAQRRSRSADFLAANCVDRLSPAAFLKRLMTDHPENENQLRWSVEITAAEFKGLDGNL